MGVIAIVVVAGSCGRSAGSNSSLVVARIVIVIAVLLVLCW